jgi:hypothetical protein
MRLCGKNSSQPISSQLSVLSMWVTGYSPTNVFGKVLESYLRNNHITHPARITPPVNIAKQYSP